MSHPDVDYTRTVSNDVVEMLATLGVEAARNALLKELRGAWGAWGAGARAWAVVQRRTPASPPSPRTPRRCPPARSISPPRRD